jgi:regulator of protease activity HflC (stomatin/prohibitin superfamily)
MEMQTQYIISFVAGCGVIALICAMIMFIKSQFFIEIPEGNHLIVLRFGKLLHHKKKSGLFFCPHFLPWIQVLIVSTQRDFREYSNISINDSRGTSLSINFWVEFKIFDPLKAIFQVENWEESLQSSLVHVVTNVLSTMDFMQIHQARMTLREQLKEKICQVTHRWGIDIEMIFIHDLELSSEISKQMIHAVSARLDRAKANIEEEGRLKVARLEAETNQLIAEMVAKAKGQFPLAVGRAYQYLKKKPDILQAYQELYECSQIRPHRTTAFLGFSSEELPASLASMITSQQPKVGNSLEM